MLQRSTLACNDSSGFIPQELKTVHTRRLPNKKDNIPKSILNLQTAKHIMCLKQISPLCMNIRTETSRTEIRRNTVRQGSQRLGQRWKEGRMRSRKKGKETEKKMHHLYSESQLELNWHLCARRCIAFNCTVLHCTPLSYTVIRTWYTHYITPHRISRREQVSFLCMCMFLCGVFVYMSRCFWYFFMCVFCFAGVYEKFAHFQIESLYIAPVFCLKGNSHLQADRSLFRERFQ